MDKRPLFLVLFARWNGLCQSVWSITFNLACHSNKRDFQLVGLSNQVTRSGHTYHITLVCAVTFGRFVRSNERGLRISHTSWCGLHTRSNTVRFPIKSTVLGAQFSLIFEKSSTRHPLNLFGQSRSHQKLWLRSKSNPIRNVQYNVQKSVVKIAVNYWFHLKTRALFGNPLRNKVWLVAFHFHLACGSLAVGCSSNSNISLCDTQHELNLFPLDLVVCPINLGLGPVGLSYMWSVIQVQLVFISFGKGLLNLVHTWFSSHFSLN